MATAIMLWMILRRSSSRCSRKLIPGNSGREVCGGGGSTPISGTFNPGAGGRVLLGRVAGGVLGSHGGGRCRCAHRALRRWRRDALLGVVDLKLANLIFDLRPEVVAR